MGCESKMWRKGLIDNEQEMIGITAAGGTRTLRSTLLLVFLKVTQQK